MKKLISKRINQSIFDGNLRLSIFLPTAHMNIAEHYRNQC